MAIRIRDELGVLFQDEDFAVAFSTRGRPALSPARLALVSILQFGEGLSDRQAAEAVRARIDWKYALGLELTDSGFDYSVLSEFRARLLAGGLEQRLLELVLDRAVTAGLLRSGGRQRTDSTHVLTAVRTMNRLEQVHETVRAALNALAAAAPDWLCAQAEPGWFDRYEVRAEDYRLPKNRTERIQLGHEIGADGTGVLHAVHSETAPRWLRDIPAVQTLRHIWIQQYVTVDDRLRWRTPEEQPPSTIRQISPYEADARSGTKLESHWDGYKVHLTETCDISTRYTILRYFSVYGDPQVPKPASHSWMVACLAMGAHLGLPLQLHGGGHQVRDMVHVDDVAKATVLALAAPGAAGQTINVGTGVATSVRQIAERIASHYPSAQLVNTPRPDGDPLGGYAATARSRDLLGWQPSITVRDGIDRYVAWLQANPQAIPEWMRAAAVPAVA
ncbi:transposase [Streptosporangium sp. NPDC001681]|uniref:transposase n=1 Tax=Streptosporangium sp. NPDC001681 TaxID=3154395 RepID=UPI0033293B3A